MDWKITTSPTKPQAKKDVKCLIDEIAASPKVREACKRNGIGPEKFGEVHRLVSDVVIKVFKERKMTPSDLLAKYSGLGNERALKELVLEVVKEANASGEVDYRVSGAGVEEEFSRLEASLKS